ncbi:MAG: MbnP family protein, partial [Bacteroidia bacterium]
MKVSQWLLTAALAVVLHLSGWAQSLRFDLRMGEEALELDAEKASGTNGGVTIEAFRFYVSDVAFMAGERVVYALPERYHLVDAEVPESWGMSLGAKGIPADCDGIRFALGIDSLTNVSGALGGDLDPTKGMYWAWQSGYINMKMEGTSPVCPAR